MQAARARRLLIAYASASHRPNNATSGRKVRDVDSELRAIEADQQPLYKPTQLGYWGGCASTWRCWPLRPSSCGG